MRVEIYDPAERKEKEEPLRLRLEEDNYDGSVVLIAVDEDGNIISNLLSIHTNGKLELHSAVDIALGLELDANGALIPHKN